MHAKLMKGCMVVLGCGLNYQPIFGFLTVSSRAPKPALTTKPSLEMAVNNRSVFAAKVMILCTREYIFVEK
jgi:hypothetical protein